MVKFTKMTGAEDSLVENDFIGGGTLYDSDIYPVKIKVAYGIKSSKSKAEGMAIVMVMPDKKERTETVWASSGKGSVTYKDKNGNEVNLPGFQALTTLSLLAAGKSLDALETETKTLNIYDFESKKDIPTSVECFVELHDQEVAIALQKQIVDKTQKDDSTGKYEPTGETRQQNEIVKWMSFDHYSTLSEVEAHIKSLGGNLNTVIEDDEVGTAINSMFDSSTPEGPFEGSFAALWLGKNQGETYDKSTKTAGKKAGSKEFAGSKGKDAGKKASSLFKK